MGLIGPKKSPLSKYFARTALYHDHASAINLKNAAAAHLLRCTKLEMACAIPAHKCALQLGYSCGFRHLEKL